MPKSSSECRVIHLRDDPGEARGAGVPDMCLLVTNYRAEPYEGSGWSYGLSLDRLTVFEINNSHCSCYGPWEGGWSGEPCTATPFIYDDFAEQVTDNRTTVGGIADLETARRFLQEARNDAT